MIGNQRYALLADDFTGALDTGGQFVSPDSEPILRLYRGGDLFVESAGTAGGVPAGAGAKFLVIDTESRFLGARDAAGLVGEATRRLMDAGYSRFFKKIDSTFRGNVGAELDAMLAVLEMPAAIAAAVPENGRTVEGGVIYVRGVPLKESESGRDPFTPTRSSSVRDILAGQSRRKVAEIGLETVARSPEEIAGEAEGALSGGAEILVFDGRSADDLRRVAAATALLPQDFLPVGASGFAQALSGRPAPPTVSPGGRALVVAGSLMETTIVQARRLAEAGESVGTLNVDVEDALSAPEVSSAGLLQEAAQRLEANDHLLLRTVTGAGQVEVASKERALEVAAFVGRLCRSILATVEIDSLILTGGGTALAVVEALEIDSLRLVGEAAAGIPLSEAYSPVTGRRYRISTKAGGFGSPEVLLGLIGS